MPLYYTGIFWCSHPESNWEFMITSQVLYHLTIGACLVADDGIEPPTGAYETPEIPFLQPASFFGCLGWARTSDQVINSHLLYLLSY